MDVSEIKDLEQLICSKLGENVKFLGAKIKRLTVAGENYGSLILSVDIEIQQSGQNQTVHSVAKMLPPNTLLQNIFNSPVTFRNEIAFYNSIIPCFDKFQTDQGAEKLFEAYPKFYAGRLALDPTKDFDDDAVLLMENLKIEGFETLDRKIGFDFHTAGMILAELAHLHAVSIAFKTLQPEVFSEKLDSFFQEFRMAADVGIEMKNMVVRKTLEMVQHDDFCMKNSEKLESAMDFCFTNFYHPKNSPKFRKGLFQGLVHSDLWVNNVMVKMNKNGKAENVKLVDFQIYEFGSVLRDVVFFLFSSVQNRVFENHYDDLIGLYYETLLKCLAELKCETEPFTVEVFQKELENAAKQTEFAHILMMLAPIFAEKGDIKELNEISMEDFHDEGTISQVQKDKACFVIREFLKRGWIA